MVSDNQGPAARSTSARLADHLESQRQSITDQWLHAVRDPNAATADRSTHLELFPHLPRMLDELFAFLRRRDEDLQQAKERGEYRLRDGYRMDEVLRELDALRRLLARIIDRFRSVDADFKGPAESAAAALVHQFFSEVAIDLVKQFPSQAQRSTELVTTIAHELRNLLQGLSYATKVWNAQGGEAELVHVQTQVQGIHHLLEQLLADKR